MVRVARIQQWTLEQAMEQPFEELLYLVADYQLEEEASARRRGGSGANSPPPPAPGRKVVTTTHVYQAKG